MNILPKKRWHVRTKENIARVRKDEAEAAEKERQERVRIETADREARLKVLKNKSKEKLVNAGISNKTSEKLPEPTEHINLFCDLEHAVDSTNKDHDKEVREKKEEYEKKIGYLTYLGQDTNEALGKKNWYETRPEESRFFRGSNIKATYDKLVLKDADGKPRIKEPDVKNGEMDWKVKQKLDPLTLFMKPSTSTQKQSLATTKPKDTSHCSLIKHKCKKKKHKKDKDEKELKLKKLREARLKREQIEKSRTNSYLAGLTATTDTSKERESSVPKVKPKYNSQFNPELARQNYSLY